MTKKSFNQNIKFEKDLASTFEPDFTYNNRPINRFDTSKKDNTQNILSKTEIARRPIKTVKTNISTIQTIHASTNPG